MRKVDAVSLYGSQAKLAEAIDRVPSVVSDWPEVVPLPWACLIEKMSRGRRRVNLDLYSLPPGFRAEQRPRAA